MNDEVLVQRNEKLMPAKVFNVLGQFMQGENSPFILNILLVYDL